MLHAKFGANLSNGPEEFEKVGFSFVVILQMESYHESGRGLYHTIQLN